MKLLAILFLLFILWKSWKQNHIRPGHNHLSIFFGVPGSGKTTLASIYALKYMKCGFEVLSNVPIKGCLQFDPLDTLGFNDVSNKLVIIDEAAITYNNRKFKSMPQENIEWFKLHRHYNCEVLIFSQSWNDCDITLRRLAYQYFVVRPGILPHTVQAVPIRRRIGIDEHSQQPSDIYSFYPWLIAPFKNQTYFCKQAWKLFNSWDAPDLPFKYYPTYGEHINSRKEDFQIFKQKIKEIFKKKNKKNIEIMGGDVIE